MILTVPWIELWRFDFVLVIIRLAEVATSKHDVRCSNAFLQLNCKPTLPKSRCCVLLRVHLIVFFLQPPRLHNRIDDRLADLV